MYSANDGRTRVGDCDGRMTHPTLSQCLLRKFIVRQYAPALVHKTERVENAARRRMVLVASVLLVAVPCSCSQRHSHVPPPQFSSTQEKIEVVKSLLAAKELDESQAGNPTVSRVTAEDSVTQAAKADTAIRELSYGIDVPETELANALEVPPRCLTQQKRADLIRQLEDAKALDDREEQELLKDYFNDRLVDTDKFDAQKEFVDEVVRALKIGDDVHWSTIQAALKVPASRN